MMPRMKAPSVPGRLLPFQHGPDLLREALGFNRWAVAGHSWGAELALRCAARHPDLVTAVAYVAGVGAGNGFKDAHAAELGRLLGPDRERWVALSAIPDADRTPAEERERCLLQWRTGFSPSPCAAGHALALWETRSPGTFINMASNRELWGDRGTEDLRQAAARVTCPVTMIFGGDDPRPWTATDSLLAALPRASRTVLSQRGPRSLGRTAGRYAQPDHPRPAARASRRIAERQVEGDDGLDARDLQLAAGRA